MFQKVMSFPLYAWAAIIGFAQGMKRDERGVSEVVVSALLVLIGILAVTAFWNPFRAFIAGLWTRIEAAVGGIF